MMIKKNKSLYYGSIGSLATMHGKELVIAPYFSKKLGMTLTVPLIDTDSLGTFSGERERQDSMLHTAIKKARLGMIQENTAFGIASEGSFGPHPELFFVYAGMEVLTFVDDYRGIVVTEHVITTKTNFAHVALTEKDIQDSFLKKVKFPTHGLIVRADRRDDNKLIFKGILDYDELKNKIALCFENTINGIVYVETDMRAHMNPTRMQSISLVAQKLALRLSNLCSACKCPGFGRVATELGLPCRLCTMPTDIIKHIVLHCVACDFKKIHINKYKSSFADPAQCKYCNP